MTSRSLSPALALVAIALPLFSSLHVAAADTAAAPAPAAAETLPAGVTPAQVFESYGWVAGHESHLAAFGLTAEELAAYVRGLTAAAHEQPPPAGFEAVQPVAEAFLNARVARVRAQALAANRAEEEKLLAAADRNPAVKQTASGLRYEILAPGEARRAELRDTVRVRYTGSFPDGSVFDERTRTGDPAEFPLSGVVPAWQEGLRLIGAGGRIRLYVPSKLAFGEFGSDGVPPGKALIYDIELVAIRRGASAAPAPATPAR